MPPALIDGAHDPLRTARVVNFTSVARSLSSKRARVALMLPLREPLARVRNCPTPALR